MFQPSPDFLCSPVPGCSQTLKPCPQCYKLPCFRAGQSLGERALASMESGSALGREDLPKTVKSGWVQETHWTRSERWHSGTQRGNHAAWPRAGQGDRTERLMEHWDFFSRCSHQGYMARVRLFLPPLYNARSKMYDSTTGVNLHLPICVESLRTFSFGWNLNLSCFQVGLHSWLNIFTALGGTELQDNDMLKIKVNFKLSCSVA